MTEVTAPCRLHFGLFHTPAPGHVLYPLGLPVRQFGGVGLMIRNPAVVVRAELADRWSSEGVHAQRALAFAQATAKQLGVDAALAIRVVSAPPEHVGLGVGTQLGMAVGQAVVTAIGLTVKPEQIAHATGRGLRSGIGVHGFSQGGLIVDVGKLPGQELAPMLMHHCWPEDWPLLLCQPASQPRWHGEQERAAFARKRNPEQCLQTAERLCRLAFTLLLPALKCRDFALFSETLHQFNRMAGEPFADEQGGPYGCPETDQAIQFFRELGIAGVGQSSWGPTVFAVCRNQDQAEQAGQKLHQRFPATYETVITAASPTGHSCKQY